MYRRQEPKAIVGTPSQSAYTRFNSAKNRADGTEDMASFGGNLGASIIDEAILQDLANAESGQHCANLVLKVAKDIGFTLVSLTPNIGDFDQPSFEAEESKGDCWPEGWLFNWHQRHSRILNPTNVIARRTAQPFSWGIHHNDWSVCFNPDRQQQRVMGQVFDQGISGAVTVPVHMPGNRVGKVSWIGRERLDFRRIANAYRWRLSIASQIALDRLNFIVGPTDDNSAHAHLTPREVECLNWIARGKSDEDVACIMGLSYSSIRFHVNNAARKLDCVTRGHMIARAVQQGWIGRV